MFVQEDTFNPREVNVKPFYPTVDADKWLERK